MFEYFITNGTYIVFKYLTSINLDHSTIISYFLKEIIENNDILDEVQLSLYLKNKYNCTFNDLRIFKTFKHEDRKISSELINGIIKSHFGLV